MSSIHQRNVSEYHRAAAASGHHGGHNMHLFHRDWHNQNRDPLPPVSPDTNWGTNLQFGTNFLQMHHEMVKATASEPHLHMMHESIAAWYQSAGKAFPAEWSPLSLIPTDLAYEPDLMEFPDEIQTGVKSAASQAGVTPEAFLTRLTSSPQFTLPQWFSRVGVAPGESGEVLTGAKKLADFKNTNQLGCCLVFPHNAWHGRIGGAMRSTWTAIADPIFYWGVHWHIDRVFDEYKSIQQERSVHALDSSHLARLGALESEHRPARNAFTAEERATIDEFIKVSEKLNRPLL